MRFLLALAMLLVASPAFAQLVVPLTTPDGRVACTQGMTGVGRPPSWQPVADPDAPDGWALAETAGDPDRPSLPAVHFPAGRDPRLRRHPALQADQRHPRPGCRPDVPRPERQRLLRRAGQLAGQFGAPLPHGKGQAQPARVQGGADRSRKMAFPAGDRRQRALRGGARRQDPVRRHRSQPAAVGAAGRVEPGRQRDPLRLAAGLAGALRSRRRRTACRSSTTSVHRSLNLARSPV